MSSNAIPYPTFDNIIIWRHAEAEQADFELGEQDNARQLTIKGQHQAKRMARWLKEHLPKNTVLVCSPAVRAVQTAEALNYKTHLDNALKPSASLTEVLNALAKYKQQKNILIVGHQPWLGALVAYLFEHTESDIESIQSLSVKKGAVWWLRRHSTEKTSNPQPSNLQPSNLKLSYTLRAMQTHSLL